MTKEEAIEILKSFINVYHICREDDDSPSVLLTNEDVNAFEVAIKALEQELCEDCVSRQAVLDMLEDIGSLDTETDKQYARSILESLPSVRSQSMIGHWRPIYQGERIINYRCSECEFGNTFGKNIYRMNYCPNCGAKMEVEE